MLQVKVFDITTHAAETQTNRRLNELRELGWVYVASHVASEGTALTLVVIFQVLEKVA